jgi:hypothetical protein
LLAAIPARVAEIAASATSVTIERAR